MQASVAGFICVFLVISGSFSGGDAQLLSRLLGQRQSQYVPQPPIQGSVSTADSEAYNRNIQLGDKVNLNGGITRSESLTQNENGAINGAKTTSVSKGLQVGKLDVSSTLTGSKTVENGIVSGGLAQNLNIGKIGIDSSLSKDNLKNGLGIQRNADGGLDLKLGLLNIDLSKNKQSPTAGQTGTQAEVQAVGIGANANSLSNTDSATKQIGKLTSTQTYSKSNAVGSVLKGFTSGQAGGFAGGAPSYAATGGLRRRRQAGLFYPAQFNYNPYAGGFGNPGFNQLSGLNHQRPGRQPQRQSQKQNQFIQPQFNNQFNNANAQGIANNQNPFSQQQAGANTNSQNTVNKLGQFQDNTGSSIASNLANDGSSGQLSAANTAQQSYQTAQGSGSKNAAQSQSLNFDKDSTQAASSNADTSHTKTADSERIESNSGATSNQQTKFGTATNTAQTNTATFNEGGIKGSQSNANSQSTFQGANGGVSGATTGTNSQTVKGPNGSVTNSASSQASSFSNNGGPASASASSNSGTGPNGAFTNAQGLANTQGGGSNALSQSGVSGGIRGQQSFANGKAGTRGSRRRREPLEVNMQGRTFDTIYGLFQSLFSGDTSNCNQCNILSANCCKQCCNFFPQPLPQPWPQPPPPLPPRPIPLPPPLPPIVQYPWYYQRPPSPCCPTCAPQIGAIPCGRGIGQPFPPPYYYHFGG